MNTKTKAAEKAVKFRLADPESYVETIAAAMNERDRKRIAPIHVANVMALTADLVLSHIDAIGEAFELNNGLEITLKAKLAREKDTLNIQFKPVGDFKDSASANVPDPDQVEMDFQAKSEKSNQAEEEKETGGLVCLPEPSRGLPEPIEAEVIEDSNSGEEEV